MKKATFIIAIAALSTLGCSTDELNPHFIDPSETVGEPETGSLPETPSEPVPPEITMGAFSYSGQIPGETAKVPTCKEGEPSTVLFEMTDWQGNLIQRESKVRLSDGLWVSETDSLPIGSYTVTGTTLMSDTGEPLYALPSEDEPDFTDYVDNDNPYSTPTMEEWSNGVLPIDIEIGEAPVSISGTSLCYIPSDIEVDGGFGPGIGTKKLQTMVVYVTGEVSVFLGTNEYGIDQYQDQKCIDLIYVVVDGFSVIDRYVYNGSYNRYPLIVPTDYDRMTVYSTDDQSAYSNVTQSYTFTRENPYDPEIHGALIFDKCDEQKNQN